MRASPAAERYTALAVAAATLLAALALQLPFLASYRMRGETAALMLHSTRFFPAHPGEWLRSGFSLYFVNYPEATRPYTGFVRPMVNASIWLESLLAAGPDSPLFLLTNYLGHAACAALVYLVARRIGGLARPRALLAAALFAGSLSALELLQSPAYRADMLGACFAVAALLAAEQWLRGGGAGWIAAALGLLLLAVLSKETAVPAPLMCAGWLLAAPAGERTPRARRGAAALLLAPLLLFAVLRLNAPPGAYTRLAGVRGNLAEGATAIFFPGAGAVELRDLLSGYLAPAEGLRVAAGFALNLAIAALALAALARRRAGAAALAGLAAGALAIPALLSHEPRMLYFGQMLALPLLAAVLPTGRLPRALLVGAALVLGPLAFAVRLAASQPGRVAENRAAGALAAALTAELRDPALRRLYLLNDRVGWYGAGALLRVTALRAGRPDVVLRTIDTLGGSGRSGRLALQTLPGALRVDQRCGDGCDFAFPGVPLGGERRLGVPGLIAYPRVEARRLVVDIPAGGCDFAVVGFSPAAPGVHRLRGCGGRWQPVAPDAERGAP